MRLFRNFAVGDRQRLGPIWASRHEAVSFAQKYDPQPFHLSDEGAAGHPFFSGLALSGWLTCALLMRLIVDDMRANPVALIGSPGVERIRWKAPVYPEDRLMLETVVTGLHHLPRRTDVGVVRLALHAWNGDRAKVLDAEMSLLVATERVEAHWGAFARLAQ
jgi:acyl dehydratase